MLSKVTESDPQVDFEAFILAEGRGSAKEGGKGVSRPRRGAEEAGEDWCLREAQEWFRRGSEGGTNCPCPTPVN